LGEHLEVIDHIGQQFSIVVVLVLIALVAWHFRHHFRRGSAE
jgi:hypothetical protein